MKKSLALTLLSLFAASGVIAQTINDRDGSVINLRPVTIQVVDDAHRPIPNVNVIAKFTIEQKTLGISDRNPSIPFPSFYWKAIDIYNKKVKTDKDGKVTVLPLLKYSLGGIPAKRNAVVRIEVDSVLYEKDRACREKTAHDYYYSSSKDPQYMPHEFSAYDHNEISVMSDFYVVKFVPSSGHPEYPEFPSFKTLEEALKAWRQDCRR